MSEERKTADRRSFLKLAGAGVVGGSAAAVAAVSGSQSADAASDEVAEGQLYRETEHVKRFYALAREF